MTRFILGIVFIMASVEKITLPEVFAENISAYAILPTGLINIVALVIPWVELICGIFLVAGVSVRPSALVLSLLIVMFIIMLISALLRGLRIDCGCIGTSGSSVVSWWRVFEDMGLLILSLHSLFFTPGVKTA